MWGKSTNTSCDGTVPFFREPTGYEKTILSDLQGGWLALRSLVVESADFEGRERMLFHIDEAMSWETVRNLDRMKPLLILIRNIAIKSNLSEDIQNEINDIDDILKESFQIMGG